MLLFLFSAAFCLWGSRKRPVDQNGFPFLPECDLLFYENFTDPNVLEYWIASKNYKFNAKWENEQLFPLQTRRSERGIVVKDKERSAAISHKFRHPINVPNETLVIQFEARAQFLFTCTSMYMFLFTDPDFEPLEFSNSTHHIIEFGPERCLSTNMTKLSFFTDSEEGSLKQVEHKLKTPQWIPVDEISHLYTLVIRPNNTFEYMIDNRSMRNGTFTDDFTPSLVDDSNSPMIDDPNDVKPDDWDDRALIRDPNEKKPKDWDDDAPPMIPDPKKLTPPKGWLLDEPKTIMDSSANKPRDWNEQLMGEWKPQLIPNPKCASAPGCGPYTPPKIRNPKARGKWRPKYIQNPNYKGEWHPRKIPNPNYKPQNDKEPQQKFVIPPLTGIGFNVWTQHREIAFTNVLIGTNETEIKRWNNEDFNPRQRRQIRTMKINYDWIFTDEPPDVPGPGISGKISYVERCIKRRWQKVQHKPVVLAMSSAIILVLIPLIYICYDTCFDDPFAHYKTD